MRRIEAFLTTFNRTMFQAIVAILLATAFVLVCRVAVAIGWLAWSKGPHFLLGGEENAPNVFGVLIGGSLVLLAHTLSELLHRERVRRERDLRRGAMRVIVANELRDHLDSLNRLCKGTAEGAWHFCLLAEAKLPLRAYDAFLKEIAAEQEEFVQAVVAGYSSSQRVLALALHLGADIGGLSRVRKQDAPIPWAEWLADGSSPHQTTINRHRELEKRVKQAILHIEAALTVMPNGELKPQNLATEEERRDVERVEEKSGPGG